MDLATLSPSPAELHLDEPLANRAFDTLAEVEAVLEDRCVRLTEMPDVIRAHTLFHWWPLGHE